MSNFYLESPDVKSGVGPVPCCCRLRYTFSRMPAADDAVTDARTARLYVWVIVCEAVTVAALWAFGRAFS